MFSIFYFLFTELSRAQIATESLFCPHCTAMWVMSMSHGIPLIRRPSPQFLKGVHIKIILLPVQHILHHWLWFIGPSSGDTPKSLHQKRATAAISIISANSWSEICIEKFFIRSGSEWAIFPHWAAIRAFSSPTNHSKSFKNSWAIQIIMQQKTNARPKIRNPPFGSSMVIDNSRPSDE